MEKTKQQTYKSRNKFGKYTIASAKKNIGRETTKGVATPPTTMTMEGTTTPPYPTN